jgi:hypothetical protein
MPFSFARDIGEFIPLYPMPMFIGSNGDIHARMLRQEHGDIIPVFLQRLVQQGFRMRVHPAVRHGVGEKEIRLVTQDFHQDIFCYRYPSPPGPAFADTCRDRNRGDCTTFGSRLSIACMSCCRIAVVSFSNAFLKALPACALKIPDAMKISPLFVLISPRLHRNGSAPPP